MAVDPPPAGRSSRRDRWRRGEASAAAPAGAGARAGGGRRRQAGGPLLLGCLALALALAAVGAEGAAVCKDVRPTECTESYTDAGGGPSFTELQETCPGKVCAVVKPQAEAYGYTPPGEAGEAGEVEVGGWFCSGASINYIARVDQSTALPPGKREDDYARCIYNNFDFALRTGDCVAMRPPWDCDDCRAAYKDWICATVFPKCQGDSAATMGPTIVKPCRDLCFKTVRRCPAHLRLDCPDTDPRAYGDPPGCNAAGAELEDLEQMRYHFKNQY